jgi:hypothetical protein
MAVLNENKPQIEAPAEGSIIAIDPDIPSGLQRVSFEAGNGALARDGSSTGANAAPRRRRACGSR